MYRKKLIQKKHKYYFSCIALTSSATHKIKPYTILEVLSVDSVYSSFGKFSLVLDKTTVGRKGDCMFWEPEIRMAHTGRKA